MVSRLSPEHFESDFLPGDAGQDFDPGGSLTRVTSLASRWYSVPVAMIHFGGGSPAGLPPAYVSASSWTEQETLFAAYTFTAPATVVVPDLLKDPRYAKGPLVAGDCALRFFAGSPLSSPDGQFRGMFCLFDRRPRRLAREQLLALEDMAGLAASLVEAWVTTFSRTRDRVIFDSGERRYRALFENTTDAVYTQDLSGHLTAVNRAAERLTGYTREELLEMNVADLVAPEDVESVRQMALEQFGGGASHGYELALRTKDGRRVDVELSAHLLFERGLPVGLMGFARDATRHRQERTALEMAEGKLRDTAGELVRFDKQWKELHRLCTARHETVEQVFADHLETGCRVLNLPVGVIAEVQGGSCRIRAAWPPGELPPNAEVPLEETSFAEPLALGRTFRHRCRRPDRRAPVIAKNGAAYLIGSPILVGHQMYGVLCFGSRGPVRGRESRRKDFTEFMASTLGGVLVGEELKAARRDPLTGLMNGYALTEILERSMQEVSQRGAKLAVAVVDVDLLHQFNERFGHKAGDALLCEIADRLTRCLGDRNHFGRIGEDRFVAVLNSVENPEQAERLGHRMLETTREPFRAADQDVAVTLSIGISLYPRDGKDTRTLLRNADAAMCHVKRSGRNGLRIFTDMHGHRRIGWTDLEAGLQRAAEKREFQLRFQPQIQMDGTLAGLEVLLSWRHPEYGPIPASRFIPIAEQNGLIVPIGAWVVAEACRQSTDWLGAGLHPVKMAINVSAVQFERSDFAEVVNRALVENKVDPRLLELEITESTVMRDAEQSVRTMNLLRRLGISLAIDDFGTGYSSLSYLSRLPVDSLKIDQSFLHEANPVESVFPLIEAIVTMAHDLGLSVVCEGVERVSQFEVLRRAGCDRVQGHLFGRPLTMAAAARLIRSGEKLVPRRGRS